MKRKSEDNKINIPGKNFLIKTAPFFKTVSTISYCHK